jgi:hypothetical protein
MQEKFHQFDRQDNFKKIEEGLAEMEADTPKKPPLNNNAKPKAVETPDNPERAVVTDAEREKLFSRLEKPKDILSLPTSLRREGLASLGEKIATRYISISRIQTAVFDTIDKLDSTDDLEEKSLRKEIAAKADEYDFSPEDREVADDLLYHFFRNLEKIKEIKGLSDSALLERLIRNRDFLPLIEGGYHVRITPFAIHFDFDDIEDFRRFVSNNEGEAKEEYKNTYGLSYYSGGYPVTASGYKPNSEATFRHEIQHQKFAALTIDKILTDEKAERATRNEILARFAEHAEVRSIFNDVFYYGFAKKYGVDEILYRELLRRAVNAIQELQYLRFQKEEILGLLSKEKLSTWPKIVERIKRTKVGGNLIQQRKPKRVKRKRGK